MNMYNIYRKFEKKSHIYYRHMVAKKMNKHYFNLLKTHNMPIKRLSNTQKREVDIIWGKGGDYLTHELVYSVTGKFDPRICSELLFRTKIELALNNQKLKHAWTDKNYFEMYFPDIDFPVVITRNIAGEFYDANYNIISNLEAKIKIKNYAKYAIKPSLDSGLGKNVSLKTKINDIDEVFREYKRDYIIQEVLDQYEPISKLNPSSVNVIRIVSLFINGRASSIMGALRCGAPGEFTDNSILKDGMGMFVIGITEEGKLKSKGYHSCGKQITQAPNGVRFSGLEIPNYEYIKELTEKMHSKIAHFGFIGFDIAIDKNGKPIVMEYNLRGPGILYYQYVNGPLFGERTGEIISYIQSKG